MRIKKRLSSKAMEDRLKVIEIRLKQLECPHENLEVVNNFDFFSGYYRVLRCKDCGKVLEKYDNELDARLAEKDLVGWEFEDKRAKIEERIKILKELRQKEKR